MENVVLELKVGGSILYCTIGLIMLMCRITFFVKAKADTSLIRYASEYANLSKFRDTFLPDLKSCF